MMMTARGKIQRVKVSDFNPIGRNTQGVRIMSLDEGDTLAAIVRVPKEEREEGEETPESCAGSVGLTRLRPRRIPANRRRQHLHPRPLPAAEAADQHAVEE